MKGLFILIVTLFVGFTASAQTNVVNIYNSKVTINNVTVIQTNAVQPSVSSTSSTTNKTVVLSREVVERLQWESMLEQRRRATFESYIRRIR